MNKVLNHNLSISRNSKCPICLEDILNLTYANECEHAFCYDCIQEWIKEHNKCPLCRRIIRFIFYNIRSSKDYDTTEVLPPVIQREYVIPISETYSLAITPDDSGLYLVFPYRLRGQIYYTLQYLQRGQSYIIRSNDPGTLYVLPEDLEHVIRHLENVGIYRYLPHFGVHPNFLTYHRKH